MSTIKTAPGKIDKPSKAPLPHSSKEEVEIKFFCTKCNQKLSVLEDQAGTPIDCPVCQTNLSVPELVSITIRQSDLDQKGPEAKAKKEAEGKTKPGAKKEAEGKAKPTLKSSNSKALASKVKPSSKAKKPFGKKNKQSKSPLTAILVSAVLVIAVVILFTVTRSAAPEENLQEEVVAKVTSKAPKEKTRLKKEKITGSKVTPGKPTATALHTLKEQPREETPVFSQPQDNADSNSRVEPENRSVPNKDESLAGKLINGLMPRNWHPSSNAGPTTFAGIDKENKSIILKTKSGDTTKLGTHLIKSADRLLASRLSIRNWTKSDGETFSAILVNSPSDDLYQFILSDNSIQKIPDHQLDPLTIETIDFEKIRLWQPKGVEPFYASFVGLRNSNVYLLSAENGNALVISGKTLQEEDINWIKKAIPAKRFLEAVSLAKASMNFKNWRTALKSASDALKLRPDSEIAQQLASQAKNYRSGRGDTLSISLGSKVRGSGEETIDMIYVKPGSFTMGCKNDEKFSKNKKGEWWSTKADGWAGWALPMHKVTLTKGFYLGKFEITKGQYAKFVAETKYQTRSDKAGFCGGGVEHGVHKKVKGGNWEKLGLFKQGDDHPVVSLSWDDAMAFCKWASKKTGHKVRLPTEAEWEYACRAGTSTLWITGDSSRDLRNTSWYMAPKKNRIKGWKPGVGTKPVGTQEPNKWGFYDMAGNASEWVADYYTVYQEGSVTDPDFSKKFPNKIQQWHAQFKKFADKFWAINNPEKGRHVLRGGGWVNGANGNRSGMRRHELATTHQWVFGFRVAISVQ